MPHTANKQMFKKFGNYKNYFITYTNGKKT